MKKLLSALILTTSLAACNSGTDADGNAPAHYALQFTPDQISLSVGQINNDVQLDLINVGEPDINIPTFGYLITDGDTVFTYTNSPVKIEPESCTLNTEHTSCPITVTRVMNWTKDITVTPILPDEYSYIKLTSLTVHNR